MFNTNKGIFQTAANKHPGHCVTMSVSTARDIKAEHLSGVCKNTHSDCNPAGASLICLVHPAGPHGHSSLNVIRVSVTLSRAFLCVFSKSAIAVMAVNFPETHRAAERTSNASTLTAPARPQKTIWTGPQWNSCYSSMPLSHSACKVQRIQWNNKEFQVWVIKRRKWHTGDDDDGLSCRSRETDVAERFHQAGIHVEPQRGASNERRRLWSPSNRLTSTTTCMERHGNTASAIAIDGNTQTWRFQSTEDLVTLL